MTILKTTNLTKSFKGKKAVDGVSLTIEKGDVFGLIGQNGAGKTTFMRLLMSLSKEDSGEIALFGDTDKSKLTANRTRIGSAIETPAFFGNLTASQNLEYYRIQRGIPEKKRVAEVLKIVNLNDTGKKKFKDFSLGMKQRLGLALAILGHPDFLVLDEPINGLDPTGIIEMRELILRLNKEGISMLISSHILSELSQVANKYAIIHEGKLIQTLTAAQLDEACNKAVCIIVDNAEKAAVVLESNLGIQKYKCISDTEIRVYENLEDPSEISFQLNSAGVRVTSIQELSDSLEDYYLNIIGGASKC